LNTESKITQRLGINSTPQSILSQQKGSAAYRPHRKSTK